MSEKVNVNQQEANKALYISGLIILVVIVALFTNGFGLFNYGNGGNNGKYIPLEIGNAPVLGSDDAPVTIYGFSDFSCPYCAVAAGVENEISKGFKERDSSWSAPVPGIISNYIESGQVKLVFKYFPGHGTGNSAHLIGWCLNEQDLFWKFHDLAFENQEDVSSLGNMKSLAEGLGADMDLLNECISSKKYNSLLDEDSAMGSSNKIAGTPAFIINGKLVSGAQSFKVLKEIIDNELS
ncbi:hypothetical protein COU54_05770 [Candidatus Pacearchaeota archaeon CG10_big_fil_rev_8_21_14_0_10_31_24]|nr:MAG: hypothetical protein COU54_05770 [Candidatus Pacearchaeota archaeon CG10_big_fil_rev_8_21_14_0_10_31_24]